MGLSNEAKIELAYRLADRHRYAEACALVRGIQGPDWQPKVHYLLDRWSRRAIFELLIEAHTALQKGDRPAARRALAGLSDYALDARQRQLAVFLAKKAR